MVRGRVKSAASRMALAWGVLLCANAGAWWWFVASRAEGAEAPLSVSEVLPTAERATTDQIVVRFQRPRWEAGRVGERLDRAPFRCEAVAGTWSIHAPDALAFHLERALGPGRRVRFQPTADLEWLAGAASDVGAFEFDTGPLTWVRGAVRSVDATHVTCDLTFSRDVDPQQLRDRMRLDGAPTAQVQVLTTSPSATVTLRTTRPPGRSLTWCVDASLCGAGAEVPMTSDVMWTARWPETFAAMRVDARGTDESEPWLEVRCSERLDPGQSLQGVVVHPPVAGLASVVRRGRLVLTGAFSHEQSYAVTLPITLESEGGATLERAETMRVEIPSRPPWLGLRRSEGVLSPKGRGQLDLDVVNVETVDVIATKVYANNLLSHVRGEGAPVTSREVLRTRRTVAVRRNTTESMTVDLRSLLPEARGVFRVEVAAVGHRWVRDTATVVLSDLGLVALRDADGWCIWTTSLEEGAPRSGVTVTAWTVTGQSLGRAVSDVDGIARIALPRVPLEGPSWLLVAECGEDVGYLELDAPRSHEGESSGVARSAGLEVAPYLGRTLHRPGETVRLNALVRDAQGAVPSSHPLEWTVTRPDGRSRSAPVKGWSAEGFLHTAWPLAADAPLGAWTTRLHLPGSDETLARTRFLVEAFVPERLEVVVAPRAAERFDCDESFVDVRAQHATGEVARGLSVRSRATWQPEPFHSRTVPDAVFEGLGRRATRTIEETVWTLDEQGHAVVTFSALPSEAGGPWRVDAVIAVEEEGGRAVERACSWRVDPVASRIGLRPPREPSKPLLVHLPWVCLTARDVASPSPDAAWTLQRVESEWTWEEVDGRLRWRRETQRVPVADGTWGRGPSEGVVAVQLPQAGTYCWRVETDGACVERTFDVGNELESRPTHPQRVVLELPTHVTPGGVADVIVRTPFPGTLWCTVETDRIEATHVVSLDGNETVWPVPVDPSWRRGAWLRAVVVRGLEPEADHWEPRRADGVARLTWDAPQASHSLTVEAPSHARPSQPVDVIVQAPGAGEVHVWAVDEGVLARTDFATPHPGRALFAPARSHVAAHDLFDRLLEDHRRPEGTEAIGGDEDDAPMRTRRVPVRMPDCAVVWNDSLVTDARGVAHLRATLPAFEGALRWMAVWAGGDAYGSGDATTRVREPLGVQPTWPRFAAPGDRCTVPVRLVNRTEEVQDVTLTWTGNGAGEWLGDDPVEPPLAPGAERRLTRSFKATHAGELSLAVEGTAGSLRSTARRTLTVRHGGPTARRVAVSRIDIGEIGSVEVPGEFGDDVSTQVVVSAEPDVVLGPAARSNLAYPYGCVEQTTSRLFALLALHHSRPLRDDAGLPDAAIARRMQAGLDRLWSMQTPSGGLAYWPGGREEHAWGTAYVLGFLAQLDGTPFTVDAGFSTALLDSVERRLEAPSRGVPDWGQQAFFVRALAESGRVRRGRMARLEASFSDLDRKARSDLALAWVAAGDVDAARRVLCAQPLPAADATRRVGAVLSSAVMQDAAAMCAFVRIAPDHPELSVIAARLLNGLQDGRFGTTADNAFALRALRAWDDARTDASLYEGTLTIDGVKHECSHRETLRVDVDGPVGSITFDGVGSGAAVVTVTRTGPSTSIDGWDDGLEVRRTWSSGEEVDPVSVAAGTRVRVEVSVRRVRGTGALPHVAVVVPYPAGWEVEAPRCVVEDAFVRPERSEFDDDHAVLFDCVEGEVTRYAFWMRATFSGTFQWPAVEAECMDDPAYRSATEATTITVTAH